ncbi:MAG: LVIVD repeat-containing protein [Actinomycetota bacterium]
MRLLVPLLAAVAASLALGAPGSSATPRDVGAPPNRLGPGYVASDNVELVRNLPLHSDSAGGRRVGRYFYITTERDLTIYDVARPAAPRQVGHLLLAPPGEYYFPEEDVDTNGKILLVGNGGTLSVISVRDKTDPHVIGSLAGADDHTITCVLDCKWAYTSGGKIVDLRRPRRPRLAGRWDRGMPLGRGRHDVTEVAPGRVVTSTQPLLFLDARADPAHPRLLALGANRDHRFIHGNVWPRRGRDRFLLAGGESGGPSCEGRDAGTFMTWSTRSWRTSHSFRMVDQFRVANGPPTDGQAMLNQYCAHWFDPHPSFRNGGLVAMAWYEHGTRFLRVSSTGRIRAAGYFLPLTGSTSGAYWISDRIVYATDYNRGLDVLRFTGRP